MNPIVTQVADKLLGIDLKYNTQKILDVSTAMIPEHTADALDEDKELRCVLDIWGTEIGSTNGWLIWAYFDSGHPDVHKFQAKHPELFKLMDFAYERDFVFLRLDADASELPPECGLPVFSW